MLNCFVVLLNKVKSIFKSKHSKNVFETSELKIIHNNTLGED
jgi:hypothetical protein